MGKFGLILIVFLLVSLLASFTAAEQRANDKRESPKHLAQYEWSEGEYLNRVSVAKMTSYEFRMVLSTGILAGENGVQYFDPCVGKWSEFFIREGKRAPIVRVEIRRKELPHSRAISDCKGDLGSSHEGCLDVASETSVHQIRPWESVKLLELYRNSLKDAQGEWSRGNPEEKVASEVLGRILDFNWEEDVFYVEFQFRNPEKLRPPSL